VKAQGQFPVMAFWHGRILPSIYFFRDRDIVVITSDNFDGEWTAKIIHRFGYTTARGSTSRNAARAALRAKRRMEEGHAVGITVDGPRGPALVVQPGALWLAKSTGNPIVPFHIEARSYWTAPSWDASQIPYPFSRVAVVFGEPFYVPADADDMAIEAARQNVQLIKSSFGECENCSMAEFRIEDCDLQWRPDDSADWISLGNVCGVDGADGDVRGLAAHAGARVDAGATAGVDQFRARLGEDFDVAFLSRVLFDLLRAELEIEMNAGRDALAVRESVLQNARVHVHVGHLAAGA